MAEAVYKCLKCGNDMAKGFIVDSDRNDSIYQNYFHAFWVEGDPAYEKSLFGKQIDSIDIRSRKVFRVMALRCSHCGFLESYAI